MPGGRPPKPIEQKRRLGNPGKRPLPANLIAIAPAPIDRLGDDETVAGLVASGATAWIGTTDMPTVRLAQQHFDDARRLRAALDDEFSRDAWIAYRDALRDYRSCLSLLGLSPSDRSRLGVAEVKARSKLEELMDRRAKRTAG